MFGMNLRLMRKRDRDETVDNPAILDNSGQQITDLPNGEVIEEVQEPT